MMRFFVVVIFCLSVLPTSLLANSDRAQQLFSNLRCVVCDGQSLAESDAAIAIDMRNFIVAQMDAGKTDEEIVATLVKSYGETILMAPPVEGEHVIIWFLPFILLLGGAVFLFSSIRRAASSN